MPPQTSIAPTKQFSCSICKKRFSTKGNLRTHVTTIHENSGRFKCNQCYKTFTHISHLTIHQTCHTKEKPFQCGKCHLKFYLKRSLKTHQLNKSCKMHAEKKTECDLARNQKEVAVRVEQSDVGSASGGTKYNLRVRCQPSNYCESAESVESNESALFSDSDGSFESQTSDKESDQKKGDEPLQVYGHEEESNEEQSSREEPFRFESMLFSGDRENNDRDLHEFDDNERGSFRDSDDGFEFQTRDEESDREREDEPLQVYGGFHAIEFDETNIYEMINLSSDESDWEDECGSPI